MLTKYKCHKEVEAEPMSKVEYSRRTAGLKDAPNIEDAEGYRVVYPDGYVSWSPKAVFEKGYAEINHIEYIAGK